MKIPKNNIATQTFTKKGPIAFLPISNKETSIVYSIKGEKKIEVADLISCLLYTSPRPRDS